VRQLWPYLDKAVATEVHAKAREELGKLSLAKFGIKSLSLSHFALGPPLKLCGVKVHDTGSADALVLDIDLRVAGAEPNAVVRVATVAGVELVIQLAALQLHTTARVTLSPLLPAPPFVGAVSVALLSIPFVDFSVTGLKGDLMALPGLEAAIAAGLKKGLAALIWPRRLVVPLLPDPDGYPALQPRSRGALLLRLRAARGLPVVDAAPGASIDPYMRVSVSGHDVVAETVKRRVTRSPTFDLETVLPVFDPATAVLQLELWDTNTLAADELVSTAELFVAELLSRQGQGGTAFSGWVPLQRCEGGLLDISAGLAVASAGVASAARSLRGLVVNADKSKAEQGAAVHPGGEALLEFTFVPFAPLGDGDEAPPQLPAGWELPATDRVLSVRLLRGEDLHPPAGWGRATPFVELRAGSTRYVSKTVPGTSPAWHELHELVLDLEAAPRLHLTVSAGPPKASAVDAVTGALNGAATVATLGVLGSRGGADELRLRGRTGGVLGRVPSCAAEAEVPPAFDASFCGRAVVDLRDVERRCALAGGPVCDTLPLQDIISGALVCVFEMRRLVAMPADGDANDVAVAAQPAEAEVAAPAAPTPVPAPSRRDALNVAAAAEAAEVLPLRETVVHDGIAVRKPNKRFSCFGGSD
jgi:hypothetical protein